MKCKSKPQWDITSHLLGWLLPTKQNKTTTTKKEMTGVDEDVEKLCTVGGNLNGAVTMENSMEFPQKIKNSNTIWSSNPNYGYLSKTNEITVSKRYLHSHVPRIIHSSQDVEATYYPSMGEWIKKM